MRGAFGLIAQYLSPRTHATWGVRYIRCVTVTEEPASPNAQTGASPLALAGIYLFDILARLVPLFVGDSHAYSTASGSSLTTSGLTRQARKPHISAASSSLYAGTRV
jgi:hypothetical protein